MGGCLWMDVYGWMFMDGCIQRSACGTTQRKETQRKESKSDDREDNRRSIKLCDKHAIQGIHFYRYIIDFLRKKNDADKGTVSYQRLHNNAVSCEQLSRRY
ncbi:hypothetical protein BFI45_10000 [Yersinia pestis subsp. microtus bv. Altaica]|nr:hypothetical protein AC599_07490 [Yersinia pestis subsp. microtus bv. Altaica]MBE7758176.1 hypothetical protein [Yersinia pestis]MBE7762139.1 hypothetical protein [Yersinia pestis]MBE7770511.1 hypothetical protein [Yersinia pestis]MBE7778520.1 hypothetical protein [Yersinia pestis]